MKQEQNAPGHFVKSAAHEISLPGTESIRRPPNHKSSIQFTTGGLLCPINHTGRTYTVVEPPRLRAVMLRWLQYVRLIRKLRGGAIIKPPLIRLSSCQFTEWGILPRRKNVPTHEFIQYSVSMCQVVICGNPQQLYWHVRVITYHRPQNVSFNRSKDRSAQSQTRRIHWPTYL